MTLITRLRPYLLHCIPRPNSGNLARDCLYLFMICAVQFAVIPNFFNTYLFDLITPWLIVNLVFLPGGQGLCLAVLAALAVETHGAAPAGIHMSSYLIVTTVIILSRSSLSWTHVFTWAVTIAAAELLVILFEVSAGVLIGGTSWITFGYVFNLASRIVVAAGFGIWLVSNVRVRLVSRRRSDGTGDLSSSYHDN